MFSQAFGLDWMENPKLVLVESGKDEKYIGVKVAYSRLPVWKTVC